MLQIALQVTFTIYYCPVEVTAFENICDVK